MRYTKFTIENYRAVKNATLDLSTEGLVLLLGINESGKTSVLRAIESFDYTSDATVFTLKKPLPVPHNDPRHFP